ncbi:helix-turn-helix transcriptional regulator [Pseudomonadaceae bacterium Sa2CUA2]|uniref:Helix-turn-helix transcriptional regulator n=1 Tax=Serpens gallinarum TaxID=2763075 RepID=A0ABR8TN38_9PSED|nr:helix-turn-helix transcriptional regulator [Serpens gallinarum]
MGASVQNTRTTFHSEPSRQPDLGRLPFFKKPWLSSRNLDEAAALLCSQIEERNLQPCAEGEADIHFTLQAMPQLKLFGADFGQKVRVSSLALANWHAILPLRGSVTSLLEGHTAEAGDMMLFTPGYEVDAVWHKGTQAVVLTLETVSLAEHVMRHHQIEMSNPSTQAQVITRDNPALVSLGNLLRLVDSEVASPVGLLATPAGQQHIQHLFCENLLHLIPSLRNLPPRSVLPGTVKRVVDYIHAHLEKPLCISLLVSVSGTSRRSLEQAFRVSLGTSPQRYIKNCKLKVIRDLLLRHQPGEVQLSELAHRWGFAQPSHFTTAYKQAFGEPPSKTLARQH